MMSWESERLLLAQGKGGERRLCGAHALAPVPCCLAAKIGIDDFGAIGDRASVITIFVLRVAQRRP